MSTTALTSRTVWDPSAWVSRKSQRCEVVESKGIDVEGGVQVWKTERSTWPGVC